MGRDVLDERRLRRLIDVGRGLVAQLDLEAVLSEVIEVARELTGARYAALGVLDEDRRELERFIYAGIDDQTRAKIGDLPRGHGVLGELIRNPAPLRLREVGAHPRSYGFPPGHPPMRSFLGVPIVVRGQAYGNLYLTEKEGGGEFDEADEEAVTILAEWAAVTIFNVRLYSQSEEERGVLERAVHGLEATTEIARAVGGETDRSRVMETIAKRARALVGARSLLVLLRDGGAPKSPLRRANAAHPRSAATSTFPPPPRRGRCARLPRSASTLAPRCWRRSASGEGRWARSSPSTGSRKAPTSTPKTSACWSPLRPAQPPPSPPSSRSPRSACATA